MRKLLRYNFVSLPLLVTAMVGLVLCLLFSRDESLWWLASVAPMFAFVIMACGTWLLFKLGVWAVKPVAMRWLALFALISCSIYTQMPLLMIGGALFLLLASTYWWFQGQFVPAERQMTKREQMYWVLLNEYMGGPISSRSRSRW
jgi:hypothetical protein